MYIMSNDENKQEEENPELSNSQESTTSFPSKASIEKDGELTAKEPAEERRVVVVKPSESEYKKENNQIEYSSAREQNKEGIKYERIMFEIEREEYETQKNLLTGYKKLLEQVNVIDSKLSLVKRLKDISK
jgi:hypothetical protein